MVVAIYNVWGDLDLLGHSVRNIRPLVDAVIIVYSETSNFGEFEEFKFIGAKCYRHEPDLNLPPAQNERNKRNFAFKKAKELGFTHFLNLDADEFYEPAEFLKEKDRILKNDITGTVCRTKVYFKSPTLTTGYDITLVPFIHKITDGLKFEWNTKYPFAFEGPKREIRIDPTRQLNITSGVEMSEITMHHMSWIRSDIKKKIRNSSARQNIEKSTIVRDYRNAKEGYYCEFYRTKLEACENLFNLPELRDESISPQSISQESTEATINTITE